MKPVNFPIPNKINPRIILGLGNPGSKYESTYHNAGHLFIDYLTRKLELKKNGRSRSKATLTGFEVGNRFFCKNLTFMNLSGAALKDALKIRKVKPEEILIAHDDSDIEIGSYKLSFQKNSAGHKGVDSVIKTLGSKNFWRLRIGIRPVQSPKGLPAPLEAARARSVFLPLTGPAVAHRAKAGLPAVAHRAKAGTFVLKKISSNHKKILYSLFGGVIEKLIENENP